MGITEMLASFLVETGSDDFAPGVIERAKHLIIDFIGGALGGCNTKAGSILMAHIAENEAKPEAGIIGKKLRTTAAYASYLNGVFNHATELESVSQRSSPNPLAVIAASIAMGEKMGLSGTAVIGAVILGYEIQGRIGGASLLGVSKKGRVSIFNHLGAAAAASKLLNLGVHETRMALGIAAFQAGGLITTVGTMAHVLELPVAARDGIESALLAEKGCTSPPNIIEMPQGFCDALIEEGGYDLDKMVENLGKTYQIVDPGISIKQYPCCYRSHRALDALFDIIREHNVSYDDIDRLTVDMNLYDSLLMKFPEPKSGEEAKFSFPHILAAAILKGEVWVDSFTDESITDPAYEQAKEKVDVVVHPEWPAGRAEARTPLTLQLKDGRVFSKEIDSPREPTLDQLLDRYRQAADGVLSPNQIESSIELLLNLESVGNVSELMACICQL